MKNILNQTDGLYVKFGKAKIHFNIMKSFVPFGKKGANRPSFVIFMVFLFTVHSFAQKGRSWEASPETIKRVSLKNPKVNFHEDKVKAYTLPNPLLAGDGSYINKVRKWEKNRRPEILELFKKYVYGKVPNTPYEISFNLKSEDKNAMNGKATLKQVDINISTDTQFLVIHLNFFIPNNSRRPAPLFFLINNRGVENTNVTREVKSEFWPAEEVIARGYGIAAFKNADVDPDNYDGFKNGIHGMLDQMERDGESWGTIAAWAWGASRCMDYFETDIDVDHKKIAVVGHSRGGKTALWAGATDERFAMVISNESGAGGASLARRNFGETVEVSNRMVQYWYCENYKQFSDNVAKLPVDQHMLIALTAPRAVYIASADEDLWADHKGTYLAYYHAIPVYQLYSSKTSLPQNMPALNRPAISNKVGYHIRDGDHNMLLKDWIWFMDFADKTFK